MIFANGDMNDGPAVQAVLALPGDCIVIAADGGLRLAEHFGLRAAYVIGDMDSALPEAIERASEYGAQIIRYPAAKDETDLELALLKAAELNCDPIHIIGAMGDRVDQSIANLYLLALPQIRNYEVKVVSHGQTTRLIYPGTSTITGNPGDTVSLIPMAGDASGITTEGLQYPLRDETLYFGPARGISTVLVGTQGQIPFKQGLLLITHTLGRA